MAPRVTVVVPNYNHARYLEPRMRSVLEQTYRDFEVLLLDDASTDDSAAVIARFSSLPQVRVIANEVNSGSPFKQWNRGVQEARGELVWIAESDDLADPRLLSSLVAQFDRHPGLGLAYCQSRIIDAQGRVLGSAVNEPLDPRRWSRDFVASGREECARYLAFRNTIPSASAVLFRRELYQAAGGADETMRLCGDWLVWVNILLRSDLAFVAEPLSFHRTHPDTLRTTVDYERSASECWKVTERVLEEVELAPADLRRLRRRLATEWAAVTVVHQKQAWLADLERFRRLAAHDPLFGLRAGWEVLRCGLAAARRRLPRAARTERR